MKGKIIILTSADKKLLETQTSLLASYVKNHMGQPLVLHKTHEKNILCYKKISPEDFICVNSGIWLIIEDHAIFQGDITELHVLADLHILIDSPARKNDMAFNTMKEQLLEAAFEHRWPIVSPAEQKILSNEIITLVEHITTRKLIKTPEGMYFGVFVYTII